MSLVNSMDAIRDHLIASNLTGIDETNCVVESEDVFNRILLNDDPDFRRTIIIGYDGMERRGSSEFGGTLLCWKLTVTAFVLLWGDVQERRDNIHETFNLIDEIFQAFNDYGGGGDVMDGMITSAEAPFLYERQQMNDYMMVVLNVDITENLD